MSSITLMAGTPQSLCRAWHSLQALDRHRQNARPASGRPSDVRPARRPPCQPREDICTTARILCHTQNRQKRR